ncbi:hypothetical protein GGX14DRAFT_407116 [Mycena pura]|uniref:Uncharacterized protein n=1 Tax=Mycena pura TaxID=153505 RepID=A0AAD6UNI1_9AGAR|nr:hypothetical protein GGX14DRAFT_407116 [Mycena pura]
MRRTLLMLSPNQWCVDFTPGAPRVNNAEEKLSASAPQYASAPVFIPWEAVDTDAPTGWLMERVRIIADERRVSRRLRMAGRHGSCAATWSLVPVMRPPDVLEAHRQTAPRRHPYFRSSSHRGYGVQAVLLVRVPTTPASGPATFGQVAQPDSPRIRQLRSLWWTSDKTHG